MRMHTSSNDQMEDPIYFYSRTEQYAELSNFHDAPFLLDGLQYRTVEHFFQCSKFPSHPDYQEAIRSAPSPGFAKRLGSTRQIKLRADWERVKESIMERA